MGAKVVFWQICKYILSCEQFSAHIAEVCEEREIYFTACSVCVAHFLPHAQHA
jgi:hypothetical protein